MPRGLAVAIIALVLLAGCAELSDGPAPVLPADRLALPRIDPSGYQALLRQLRGTPVVVNFWGSWCGPCVEEAPDLAEVAREYRGRVQFFGVDILDAREPARDFIRRFDWPYASVFDPTGSVRDSLGYVGQPITLVYDRRGELSFERVGAIDAAGLRTEIRKVL